MKSSSRVALLAMAIAFTDCQERATTQAPVAAAAGDVAPSADVSRTAPADILTFQYNLSRTGVTSTETILTPANVTAGSFGKVGALPVDGYVYAEPLYVAQLVTPAGQRDVVFVATEHDSVYAFDASTSAPLWHASLLETGEIPVPSADVLAPDISPEIGITGTPVIDRAAGLLYVVSKARRADKTYVQRLHALRLVDGAEGPSSPVVIAAKVPATSSDAKDGLLSFEPLRHNQRAALALIDGRVVIAWASHGDNGPYHGWLMAYDTADLTKAPAAFVTTPGSEGGGIWMGASGPTTDSEGNIYVASGNGPFDMDDAEEGENWGLCALRMRVDGGAFAVKDFFSPHETTELQAGDLDFGTSAPIVMPDRVDATGTKMRRLIVAGKTGYLYVLDRDDLGQYDTSHDNVLQKLFTYSTFLIANPVLFNDTIYVLPHQQALMAFTMDPATGLFGTDPSDIAGTCATCFDRGSTPSISADGTRNAILWVLDNGGYKTGAPAILHAYDATNLTNELYESPLVALETDSAAPAVKFTVPAVANGRVFVGGQKAVTVYGLLSR